MLEILFGQSTEAVGRTDDVTGSVTFEGSEVAEGSFEVDMTTVASDESRRDGQFNGRIMETDTFPTATFVLTEPIALDEVPAAGERVTAEATGDLTLHGVTRSVTFEVEAQLTGSTFAVDGTIPITFADYEIDNPSEAVDWWRDAPPIDPAGRAAELIAAGAGRRRLSRELGVTEYEARQLLARTRIPSEATAPMDASAHHDRHVNGTSPGRTS